MFRKGRFHKYATILVGIFLAAGCGGGEGGLPGDSGTVSGKITLNGTAIPEGSTVVFVHKEKGMTATGQVDSAGAFSLKMLSEPAILVGDYAVGISPPQSADKMSDAEYDKMMAGGEDTKAETANIFPEKYLNSETSGETFTVKTGDNTYTLDMKE